MPRNWARLLLLLLNSFYPSFYLVPISVAYPPRQANPPPSPVSSPQLLARNSRSIGMLVGILGLLNQGKPSMEITEYPFRRPARLGINREKT